MFCRNCANPMDEQAAVCVKCGVAKNGGKDFCPNCAAETAQEAIVCVRCGVSLAARSGSGTKSKLVAGLLGIFLGHLGIHNFYLGYTKKAVTQLCMTIGGGVLSICTLGITALACAAAAVWGLVEGIMILTGKIDVDADGNPLGD